MNSDSIVQPFKRSMDEARDTAVSFRYFTILEADVARTRPLQGASQPDARSEGAPKAGESAKETGDSNAAKETTPDRQAKEAHPPESSDRNTIPPADETRRRRKVKFDIKAEFVTGDGVSPTVNAESRENEGK